MAKIVASDQVASSRTLTPKWIPLRRLKRAADVVLLALLFGAVLIVIAWINSGSIDRVGPWFSGQRLFVDAEVIDLGTVSRSSIIDRSIHVVNCSSSQITLLGAKESCGCMAMDELPIVVPPKGDQFLKLRVAMPAVSGSFAQSVELLSDDQGFSAMSIAVRGVVE